MSGHDVTMKCGNPTCDVCGTPSPPAAGERRVIPDGTGTYMVFESVAGDDRARLIAADLSREDAEILTHGRADLERMAEACRITALMRIGCECERCGPCLSRAALAASRPTT